MVKAHPIELRERVVNHVKQGNRHRATAGHFRVSIKFVNDMVKLKRQTGGLARKPFPGRLGRGKLEPYKDWVRQRIGEQGDITLDQLARELREYFDVDVHRWTVGRLLHRLGLSHKKRRFMPANKSLAM